MIVLVEVGLNQTKLLTFWTNLFMVSGHMSDLVCGHLGDLAIKKKLVWVGGCILFALCSSFKRLILL